MTVIAWDGKSIAADKRATNYGLHRKTTKLRKLSNGQVIAWVGDQDCGMALSKWYDEGANPDKWPKFQGEKERWAQLIVAHGHRCWQYEREPFAVLVEDPFSAWGSGRDYALAAMLLGKSAKEAVEIASLFDTGCGDGVDVIEL